MTPEIHMALLSSSNYFKARISIATDEGKACGVEKHMLKLVEAALPKEEVAPAKPKNLLIAACKAVSEMAVING